MKEGIHIIRGARLMRVRSCVQEMMRGSDFLMDAHITCALLDESQRAPLRLSCPSRASWRAPFGLDVVLFILSLFFVM